MGFVTALAFSVCLDLAEGWRSPSTSRSQPGEQPVPAMAGFITAHLGMNIFIRAPSAELI